MNRYNAGYPAHSYNPESAGSFPQSSEGLHNEEHGSQSGSDDGFAYGAYTDVQRSEMDLEEDANSLTSQTLNADGTPKRPMNAFMIFARRRRPQVSAENQSMRTGEISKILSKEWNSMGTAEKQFYLDQAKILKDNFNNKYPDYVYRRRPNNSRKKRRSDTGNQLADGTTASDHGDEMPSGGDYGEPSPVEGDLAYPSDVGQPRVSVDASAAFNEQGGFNTASQSSSIPYNYPSPDLNFPPFDSRSSYQHNQRRSSHGPMRPTSSMNFNRPSHSFDYSYVSTQNDQRSNPYPADHGGNTSVSWDAGPVGRTTSSSWINGTIDRTVSSLAEPKHHTYSPTSTQGNWATPSPTVSPGGLSHQNNQNNHLFPTLSMPFYPATQAQGNYAGTASSGSSHSNSPSLYNTSTTTGGNNPLLPDSRYSSRSFSTSSPMHSSSISPYSSASPHETHGYQRASIQRGLPSLPHLSNTHPVLSNNNHTPTSASPSRPGYWRGD